MSATKPTQVDALDALQRDTMLRTRTVTPGVVIAYDPVTNTAQVQPAIGGVDEGTGLPLSLPILPGVPVLWPRGAGVTIRGELLPGDSVLILVSDRAIDDWLAVGAAVPGNARRMFSLADALALPMISPTTRPLPPSAGRLVIQRDDGTASITITLPSGGAPIVTIDAPTIRLGVAAVEHAAIAEQVISAIDTAWAAATPTPTDGGANLKATWLAAWNAVKANIIASKVFVE